MRRISLCLLLVPWATAACAPIQGYPDDVVTTRAATDEVKDYTGETSPKLIACKVSPTSDCRNQIIDARIYAIDAEYFAFTRSFNEDDNTVGLASDAITLVLGGLGSTLGSAATKAALAAASTGVSGINSSYSKNVLAQKTAAAIITEMDALRAQVKAIIETGKKATIGNYSLQAGLDDVLNYQRAGSLPSAIQAIATAASNDQGAAKKALTEAMK